MLKVFKEKNGRKTGNESITQFTCKVIRIGNEKYLPYIKGTVPDTIWRMLRIRNDARSMSRKELQKSDLPSVDTYEGNKDDSNERYEHENTWVSGPNVEVK